MKVTTSNRKPEELSAELYVVPVEEGAEQGGAIKELSPEMRRLVAARTGAVVFTGKAGKTLSVQTEAGDVALVGVGKREDAEALRRAAARGYAVAESIRAKTVVLCAGSDAEAAKRAVPLLEGFLLAGYRFDKYKSKNEDGYAGPRALTVAGSGLDTSSALRGSIERTRTVCESVCFARDLINEMSTVKTPTYLGTVAKNLAREGGFTCEVWQGERLKREKMNGILAVSAGSDEPGAFIRMVYKPRGKVRSKVAIIGKGITFDSGGLSIKPAKSMEWMKQDMAGAAAVLGVMRAVALLEPAVEVRGYIAAAENMTGGAAQKPGDIITYRNGTTAEVLNTDAEGRLALGDALCVASEDKPEVMIDLATLTGACIVALGTRVAGILGNDQQLVDSLISYGREVGEALWQLPLVEDYVEDIRSATADIQNIGSGSAGTITAALFLRSFVGEHRWAHMDIAGPAFAEKPFPYAAKGGTGFGIRTLLAYIESL
jgi:leucyl aminopeptidase